MKISKILGLFILAFSLLWVISACSASEAAKEEVDKKQSAFSEMVEINLQNIEYRLPSEYDNVSAEELILKVDLIISNNYEDSIDIDSSDFSLYQGDTKVVEGNPAEYNEELRYTQLGEGKKIEGSLYYVVEKGKPYELVYDPILTLEEQDPITIDIDGSDEKLLQTAEKLQNPAKAMAAYVDVLLYDVDNPNFESVTGENIEQILADFDDGFIQGFAMASSVEEIDKEAVLTFLTSMKATLKEKVKSTIITTSMGDGTAIVEVSAKPIKLPSVQPIIDGEIKEYITANPDLTEKELQEFIFRVLADEISNAKQSTEDVVVEIQMVQKGEDQWQLDVNDYRTEELSLPFISY
ncbi:DUF5105 domain-containing protein [Metabacillus sp. HB246100]